MRTVTMVQENPAALRSVAARIRSIADEVCGHTQRVVAVSQNLDYRGPSASVYFDVLHRAHNGVHAEAQSLYQLAGRLELAADEAERQLRAELTP